MKRRTTILLFPTLLLCAGAGAAPQKRDPELVNFTPFQSSLRLISSPGMKDRPEYYTLRLKAHFAIEDDNSLRMLDPKEVAGNTLPCAIEARGQAWATSTNVLVNGGALDETAHTSAHPSPEGEDCRNDGTLGWQFDGYLPMDAHLRLRSANNAALDLALPQPFVPFLLLRYQSGAMIPVPTRISAVDVNLPTRRVEVRLQSTFGIAAPLRKIEVRGIFAGAAASPGESVERFVERTQATLADLASCAPPRGVPIEPCADPGRMPNPLIFRGRPADIDALRHDYVAKLQSAVMMNWMRPPSAMHGLHCTVRVSQNPDGAVMAAVIVEPCDADAVTRKSLEQAAKAASPLPHAGYEAVFERDVNLVFRYEGTDGTAP